MREYAAEIIRTIPRLPESAIIMGPKSMPTIMKTGAKKAVPIFSFAMIFECPIKEPGVEKNHVTVAAALVPVYCVYSLY